MIRNRRYYGNTAFCINMTHFRIILAIKGYLKSAKTAFRFQKDSFGRKLHGGEGVTTGRIE
jgi:hypothetical protein